ncbi:MAG: cyclic-phosphate processing receiver domain-containing protein, partial [Methanococcaceae archaeon]
RMDMFRRMFTGHEIHHAEHSSDAVEFLTCNKYDLICLDHDLGGTQIDFDPEDCGTIVAEYLNENPVESDVIIHSYNSEAAERMLELIPGSKYIPGLWMMSSVS